MPELDRDKLAMFLANRLKDQDLSVRRAAPEIGCSPATLSRLLKGSSAENVPDTAIVLKAVSWLEMSLAEFETDAEERDSTLADVELHLRALPDLTDETADALVAMVRAVYDSSKSESQS